MTMNQSFIGTQMTTPFKLHIQSGTLCWLRHPAARQNVGKVVEVLRLARLANVESRFWFVKASTSVLVYLVDTHQLAAWPAGQEFLSSESWLVPIAGPGLADEIEAYDKAAKQETLGQLLRGRTPTRSTPFVHR